MDDKGSRTAGRAQTGWRTRSSYWLDVAANIAIVAIGLALLGRFLFSANVPSPSAQTEGLPTEPIPLEQLAIRGHPDASVGLIAFAEFECPYCVKFHEETFPVLQKEYFDSGKAFYGFRNLPLTAIHKNARRAAEAVECAGLQNRFWDFHDSLFEKPMSIEEAQLVLKAEELGLNPGLFKGCLDSGSTSDRIDFDSQLAEKLGIRGTPTFLIGRIAAGGLQVHSRVRGARPVSEFRKLIDAALAAN